MPSSSVTSCGTGVAFARLVDGPLPEFLRPQPVAAADVGHPDRTRRLVSLFDALAEWMRAAKMMDFGVQMACATCLVATFPQVGQDLRSRYRVVVLNGYQDTGHAQRVALSGVAATTETANWR